MKLRHVGLARYWIVDVPFWEVKFSDVELPLHLGLHEKSCLRLMTGYMIYDLAIELITRECCMLCSASRASAPLC